MHKLEYFYYVSEIAKHGSISLAAKALYLSQPYLSLSLKNTEKILGVKIFTRTNKGVIPTDAGKEFIKYCEAIIALVDKSNNLKKSYSNENKSFSITSMPSYTMLDLFHNFRDQCDINHQSPEISYEEIPNTFIAEKLLKGTTDIGIVYIISTKHDIELKNFEKMGLNFVPLITEPLSIVVSSHNKLFEKDEVYLKEVKTLDFLVENIKLTQAHSPVENNPVPEIFKTKANNNLKFNNNRSMLYYLSKSSDHFCIGQKSLNLTNPLVDSGHLKYIPVKDLNIYFTIGYLTNENIASSDIEEDFICFIEDFFNVSNYKEL